MSKLKNYYNYLKSLINLTSLKTCLPAFGLYRPASDNDVDALKSDWEQVSESIRFGMNQVDVQIKRDSMHDSK